MTYGWQISPHSAIDMAKNRRPVGLWLGSLHFRSDSFNSSQGPLMTYDLAGRLLGEYDAAGNPLQETLWLHDLPVAVIQ